MSAVSAYQEFLQNSASPIYSFICAAVGAAGHADKLTREALKAALRNKADLQKAAAEAVRLIREERSNFKPDADYISEAAGGGRSALSLQAFYMLDAESRILLLLRNQLEFTLDDVARCAGLDPAEARNRLKNAKAQWLRSREHLLVRKKRVR